MRLFGLTALDWAILFAYLASMVVLGTRFSRGQAGVKDYYLAGKSMSWIPVGLSTIAALISGNTYLGLPSEVSSHGLAYLLSSLSVFLAMPVTLAIFLPFYRRLDVTTAYEYLEKRFNVWVRRQASAMFVVWRLIWIAMVIYVPSLALSGVTSLPLVPTIVAVGILTTAYTAVGGMKAVIWTDVAQFFVMLGGAVLAIWIATLRLPGGLSQIWYSGAADGRTRLFDFSWDPRVRMSFWGLLLGGALANLAYLAADQVVVQRYLTAKSDRDARWSIILNCFGTVLLVVPLAFLGLALHAYYGRYPALLRADVSGDRVFPYFIATEFPAGVVGLVLAGIYAATMSSLSSGINAIATALDVDFSRRRTFDCQADSESAAATRVRFARILTVAIGGVTTLLACFVGRLGTIVEIGLRFIDGFSGPLLGLFLLGVLTERATARGACIGSVLGIAATTYANFLTPISFIWFPAVGCGVTVVGGYFASRPGGAQADSSLWVYSFRSQQSKVRVNGRTP